MNHFNHETTSKAAGKKRWFGGLTFILAVVWAAVVVASMVGILRYTNVPGRVGAVPMSWPMASRIQLDTNRPTLIMFVHPHCPCTESSVSDLAQLMADCGGKLSAQVWLVKPPGTTVAWTDTELKHSAAMIPGVAVFEDKDGVEAQRFQAETSGQTVLYATDGKLLFHGGLTISRGHAGDNPGSSAVEALLANNPSSSPLETPVFGCPLFSLPTTETNNAAVCINSAGTKTERE